MLAISQSYLLITTERDRLGEIRSIEKRMALRSAAELQRYNPAFDPKLGERLPPLQVSDGSGKRAVLAAGRRGHYLVVVFAGECTPCLADVLRNWQQVVAPNRSVYVVTQSSPEEVSHVAGRYGLRLPFLFDRPGNSLGRYNVAWRPRSYLLDAEGRLKYIQQRWEPSEIARNKVVSIVERETANGAVASLAKKGGGA